MCTAACDVNAIDFDCVSEHFILNPSGGGIAWMGSTGYELHYGRWFDVVFFDSLFQSNVYKLAKCHAVSKYVRYYLHADDNYFQYARLLLGEPELSVWTNTPPEFVVSHSDRLPVGTTQFSVQVQRPVFSPPQSLSSTSPPDEQLVPVPDALVCPCKYDMHAGIYLPPIDCYSVGYTDTNGYANLTVTPQTTDELIVTVTKHNFIPY